MTDATASSISPTISLPCEANDAWLAWRVIVFSAFMRSAKNRSVSGGIMRSFAETWNQLGFTFQAVRTSLRSSGLKWAFAREPSRALRFHRDSNWNQRAE